MSATLAERFARGRGVSQGVELLQVLGALRERFGTGARQPVLIGRYVVQGRLGSGGLGLVYRAHDPTLDRAVAIKVLKPGREAAGQDAQLLREAQVLARIRHPHVVEVFDVGFFEDCGRERFFVAMELVQGHDLRQWLQQPRSLAEVLDVLLAAAQGLHAAHEQGLLHRDFKPSNVLVGDDGAVKVADFGLAAFLRRLEVPSEVMTWTGTTRDEEATPSWRLGGTPSYMAPEQHRGEALTPACDQYGFCVSLYEALYGWRPFGAAGHRALLEAKEDGVELTRPAAVDVRTWAVLRRVLQRGLHPSPEGRFADMEELRRQLLAARSTPRRGWLVAAGATAVAGVVVAAGALMLGDSGPVAEDCPAAPAGSEQGAPAVQGALAERLQASPALAEAWPGLAGALDEYAADLRDRWDSSCALPQADRGPVQACLERSADALISLRELFDEGDAEVLAKGWSLLPELLDLQACTPDAGALDRGPEMLRRATRARANVLATAGRADAAREVLAKLHEELEGRASDPVMRLVEVDQAELSMMEGRLDEAQTQLEAVHFEAAAAGDTYSAARAAVKLVGNAYARGDVDAALHWARTARPLLSRLQPRDVDLEAVLEHNVAAAHFAAGDLQAASSAIRDAIERASAPGVSPVLLAGSQQVYAEILLHAGRPAEALAIHRLLLRTGHDPSRRDVLVTMVDLQSLGNTLITLHDDRGALRAYRRSYELGASALGLAHPNTAAACLSLARAEGDAGEVARGQQLVDACLPGLEQRLGDEHPHVAVARAMGGRLAWQAGDHERAIRALRSSVASLERIFGESHYVVADLLHELGVAYVAAGDPASARQVFERTLGIRRDSLSEGHVNTAETLAELSMLDHADGESGRARARLSEALQVFEERGLDAQYVAGWRARLAAMPPPEPPPTQPEASP
ncbi:MAG: protein kinase [Nannocystaceae bacterium]